MTVLEPSTIPTPLAKHLSQIGDVDAFVTDFHNRHRESYIQRTAGILGGDLEQSEEIVQQAFYKAWARRDQQSDQWDSWFHSIWKNCLMDYFRRKMVIKKHVLDEQHFESPGKSDAERFIFTLSRRDDLNAPDLHMDQQERLDELDAFLMKRLTGSDFVAHELKHLCGLSHRDVREMLEITTGALTMRLKRTRMRVKEFYERCGVNLGLSWRKVS